MYHFRDECYSDSHPIAQDSNPDLSRPVALKKPRRKPQSADIRADRLVQIEAAQAVIAHLEGDAGPTLRKEVDATKIIERAVDQHRMRESMTIRLLSQRAGLFKLLNAESTCHDFDNPTARVKLYFDRLLALSANLAAVSGTGWPAAWGWLRDRLPLPADRIGAKVLEARFNVLLSEAHTAISGRPILRERDLRTAPSAQALAETFGTTMADLRAAEATRCQLTAVDAKPKKEQNRLNMEATRRAKGMKAQADRKLQERDQELADLANVSDRWIRKHRLAGTLGAFLAAKGIDAPETASSQKCVSGKENKGTHFRELRFPRPWHHRGSVTTLGGSFQKHPRMTRTMGSPQIITLAA